MHEFQKFLTSLSVLPGRCLAICAHLHNNTCNDEYASPCTQLSTSSSVCHKSCYNFVFSLFAYTLSISYFYNVYQERDRNNLTCEDEGKFDKDL